MRNKPFIYTKTDAFMSAVIDHARNGYTRYTAGNVPLDKLSGLATKFATFYRVDADRNERFRMKKHGIAPAALLIRQKPNTTTCDWILMVFHCGDTPAAKAEQLRMLETKKTRYGIEDFELVRRDDKGKLRWTWQMSRETGETIRGRIVEAIRQHNEKELAIVQLQLWSMPGFAAIRKQIGMATALARAEWKRRRSEPWKEWPAFLRYFKKIERQRAGYFLA